ncbi:MAG: hypothetical protein IPN76_14040 [Saprospiraceae bacterium]|nr:hypothetical protein [Saprospiraceae bacterium]
MRFNDTEMSYADARIARDSLKNLVSFMQLELADAQVADNDIQYSLDHFVKQNPRFVQQVSLQTGQVSVAEAQRIYNQQRMEFKQDLELLFSAFQHEMNSLMSKRAVFGVKKRDILHALDSARQVYEQLRKKYDTDIFDQHLLKLNAEMEVLRV